MIINVAAMVKKTQTHGPGVRSAVWVQGCHFGCAGCIAPDWQRVAPAMMLDPVALAEELAAVPAEGLTISGGEPMEQAAPVTALVSEYKRLCPDRNVMLYTGFKRQDLTRPYHLALLYHVDILVDGLYIDALNDDQGQRGSSNQVIHGMSETGKRLIDQYALASGRRNVEIHSTLGGWVLVGVPERGLLNALRGEKWSDR